MELPIRIRNVFDLKQILEVCGRPSHLRRTGTIALVVGSWLTLFNQGDAIRAGETDTTVFLKILLNYLTPFVVANLGLLSSEEDENKR